ncbi:unnamed protein product (macronuclear) [Paramecium tetraurelia]|uniref:PIPK domain-containing protein n=1 Tax=Paramecium tetraurelia TaxID=5888 RepID=A0CD60_PARTE|nr:uncharacterized protein GSPATT00006938001 [Paramecium tetraurelia]CAK68727.1 unnamed protein product [Paramecium tetraurelia]|eukprot:XP_001436124.1 hypothetical protein (macronuclear) [Paramecium tetraurelia strain d4-2]
MKRRINFIHTNDKKKFKKYDEYDFSKRRIGFSEKEIKKIRQSIRFLKLAQIGYINYQQFRESLGIMGLANAEFLSLRLFHVIDIEDSNKITFEDFLNYLNILVNGNKQQKAEMSFRFLDITDTGRILQNDIEQLCADILLFWHQITGSKVLPNLSKVEMLIKALGMQSTGEISFSAYLDAYDNISNAIDWFEFFNDTKTEKQSIHTQEIDNNKLQQSIDNLQDEVLSCIIQLKNSKRGGESIIFDANISQINQIDNKIDGPFYVSIQTPKRPGDVDPSQEVSVKYQANQPQFSLFQNDSRIHKIASFGKQDKLIVLEQKKMKKPMSEDFRRATIANIPKKHKAIYFGHENWNLVISMMIGMRACAQALCPLSIELKDKDFKSKYIYNISNSNNQNICYQFVDYAGLVYERIRSIFKISQKHYLTSIGKLTSLSELSSTGKSGSFFYFTDNGDFMIKTISKNEFKLLSRIIQQYYQYIRDYGSTYLSKILGQHVLKAFKDKTLISKTYIIVIVNVFQSPLSIDVRYDLKGSTYGRKTKKANKIPDKNVALKDLDFLDDKKKILLDSEFTKSLLAQFKNDVLFLESCSIIDYSLLIGIHSIRHDSNIKNQVVSNDQKEVYFIGIIDILTEYNMQKQIEYSLKHTFVDSNISCVPPREYAMRFLNFIKQNVFV